MKERLTGAIILVALIVLLVPELLTGPIGSSPRADATSASAEEAPLRSYTIKLTDDSRARTGAGASGPEQPIPLASAAPSAPPPEPTPPGAAPAASGAAAVVPSPAPKPPARTAPPRAAPAKPAAAKAAAKAAAETPAAGTAGAWMVQLGSFASRGNAERLAQQVREGGFRVSVSQSSSGRHLYRVLVGPAHDRAGAGQLAAKLQAAGHSGSVVPR